MSTAFPPLGLMPRNLQPTPQQFQVGDLVVMGGQVWQIALVEPGSDGCHLARHISVDGAMDHAEARYHVPKQMLCRLICVGELQHYRLIPGTTLAQG